MPGDRFVQESIDRAAARVRAEHPSTPADAQRALARAHGFESWAEFADHVEGIAGNAFERGLCTRVQPDGRLTYYHMPVPPVGRRAASRRLSASAAAMA